MPNNNYEDDMDFTFKIKDIILFTWMFLLFIFSWIAVGVVGRAVDNITFNTLGLSDKSTLHTIVIAMVIVIIEILTLYYFNSLGMNLYGDSIIDRSSSKIEKLLVKDDKKFLNSMSCISIIEKIEGVHII